MRHIRVWPERPRKHYEPNAPSSVPIPMALPRVAFWKFRPGQREAGKRLRDEMNNLFDRPEVLGMAWLDSKEDPDASLSFVLFESEAAMKAHAADPAFQEGIRSMGAALERVPPELHLYDIDLVRVSAKLNQAQP